MGDNTTTGNTGPGVTGWPPPARVMSFVFGGGAAIAGFLGYCMLAAILALLSLVFNLWDFFQGRGSQPKPRSSGEGTSSPKTGAGGPPSTAGGGTDRPDRY